MCGGKAPADNSHRAAQIEAQERREAREAEERRKAEERQLFENNLSAAYSTGISGAQDYFSSQGLDPNEYIAAIQSDANSARSRVPDLDGSPGTYFENLGASTFDRLQEAERAKAQRGIDTYAREGFATNRIANDADDPFLAAIIEEQFTDSDDYIRNALDRGVITQQGYDSALEELSGQRAGANARIQDIGLAELERGRGLLRDHATTARQGASQLRLGDGFDPYSYQANIDRTQADFFANLGANLRANAPENLFDTSGLLGIAGAAQGAQNTAFDPNGVAGLLDDDEDVDDDDEDEGENSAFTAF